MKNELISRTKRFALNCWHFCFKVPKSREYNAFVNQLIRSSSSVFEEILPEHSEEILILKKERKELLAITVASINTAKRNNKK